MAEQENTKSRLDKIKFNHEFCVNLDKAIVYFDEEIDDDALSSFKRYLNLFHDRPVKFVFNSPGGDIFAGMGIVDAIRAHSHPVHIHVNGVAASMGCVILQAAARRTASPNSIIMHHVGSMGVTSDHFANVKRLVTFVDKYNERMNKIMLDRINEKRAKDFAAGDTESKPRTMAWFKERDNIDQWMTAEEALDLGLIDEIV
jgi:ATP-dependent Clp protease protease subunit